MEGREASRLVRGIFVRLLQGIAPCETAVFFTHGGSTRAPQVAGRTEGQYVPGRER